MKGKHCIKFSIFEKIGHILLLIFLLFIFVNLASFFMTDINYLKKMELLILLIPTGILCFGVYTCLFYKLELGEKFVIREKFSLKAKIIEYKKLREYMEDDDFLFGIYNCWAKLKIGNKKYISFPINREESLIFLDELLKRIENQDISRIKINLIPRKVKNKKILLISVIFIIDIFFIIFLSCKYLTKFENIFGFFFFIEIESIILFIILISNINLVHYENEFQRYFLEERGRKIRKAMLWMAIYILFFFILENIK